MPRREGPHRDLHLLPLAERVALDKCYQTAWYKHAADKLAAGRSVLDVGAGVGYGLPILRAGGAAMVHGIDLLPAGEGVQPLRLEEIGTKAYDLVTAIDVIEHVGDPRRFFTDLCRVAREGVFFTTPNWNRSRCANEFHLFEFTPAELREFLAYQPPTESTPALRLRFWLGDDAWNIEECSELADDEQRANFGVLVNLSQPTR